MIAGHASVGGTYALKDVMSDPPRRLDRLSEMAVWVAAKALRGVTADRERAAVYFSTRYGNFSGTVSFLDRMRDKGARFASPLDFPNLVLSAPAGALSQIFGLKGEVLAFNGDGMDALWAAEESLRSGRVSMALVVGAEERSSGRDQCDPTSQEEGAAAVVLTAPGLTLGFAPGLNAVMTLVRSL